MDSCFPSRSAVFLAGILAWLPSVALRAAPPADPVAVAWSLSTPMPEPTDGYAAGAVAGRLVLAGGTYWEGTKGHWTRKIFSAATWAFDPRTQAWEKLPDAPGGFSYGASVAVDDQLLVIGGIKAGEASRDVWSLRRSGADWAWHRLAPLPEPRAFASAVTVGRTLFVVGGTRAWEPIDAAGTCCTSRTATNTVWSLDLARPEAGWKAQPDYPGAARWLQQATSDGGAIYLFGGIEQATADGTPRKHNDILRFDVARGAWTRAADLPEDLQSAPAVAVGGRILLVGATDVRAFDPATATFARLSPLPESASVNTFVIIGPFVVGAGGEDGQDGPRRRSARTFLGRVGSPPEK